jgi:hypothetical protein
VNLDDQEMGVGTVKEKTGDDVSKQEGLSRQDACLMPVKGEGKGRLGWGSLKLPCSSEKVLTGFMGRGYCNNRKKETQRLFPLITLLTLKNIRIFSPNTKQFSTEY